MTSVDSINSILNHSQYQQQPSVSLSRYHLDNLSTSHSAHRNSTCYKTQSTNTTAVIHCLLSQPLNFNTGCRRWNLATEIKSQFHKSHVCIFHVKSITWFHFSPVVHTLLQQRYLIYTQLFPKLAPVFVIVKIHLSQVINLFCFWHDTLFTECLSQRIPKTYPRSALSCHDPPSTHLFLSWPPPE